MREHPRVLAAVAIVVAALLAGVGASLSVPLLRSGLSPLGGSLAFQLVNVDTDRLAQEPVLSIASGDRLWIAGTVGVGPGNLWTGDLSGPFQHLASPTPGGGDATVFVGPGGRLHWATLTAGTNGPDQHLVAGVTTGGAPPVSWGPVTKGLHFDRPWFLSRGLDTYGVTTNVPGGRETQFHQAFLEGNAWTQVSRVFSEWSGGFPRVSTDGHGVQRFEVPLSKVGDGNVKLSRSVDGVLWETVNMLAQDSFSLAWAAVDANGNVYVVWAADTGVVQVVQYSVRLAAGGAVLGPFLVGSDTKVWGPAIVSRGGGRLAVAWYAQNDPNGPAPPGPEPWTVRYRLVTSADTSLPVLVPSGGPHAVDVDVADADKTGHQAFLDFLTVEPLADSRVVIAYNCYHAAASACGDAGEPHPKVAVQTTGPRP